MGDRERARRAFARALRRRRIRARLTQDKIAEGIARSHVSDMERGQADPKLSTLLRLSEILGVSFGSFARAIEREYGRLKPPEKKITEPQNGPSSLPD